MKGCLFTRMVIPKPIQTKCYCCWKFYDDLDWGNVPRYICIYCNKLLCEIYFNKAQLFYEDYVGFVRKINENNKP
jgi:hypothetical protein